MNIEFLINRTGIYGGIKRIYIIADYLRQAGHNVVVNSLDGKSNTWFDHSVPENQTMSADIRVCAETCRQLLPNGINILYQQAQFDAPEENEKFDLVVTTTKYLTEFLMKNSVVPDYVIPYGFDSKFFEPSTSKDPPSSPFRIAYMPRKNKEEMDLIKSLVRNDPYLCNNIEFVEIDGMLEKQVVKTLQSCYIFLALSKDEGFGMPPFEASLCGCLIIGYHGRGGKEWLTEKTCVLTKSPQEFPIRIREAIDGGQHEGRRLALQQLIKEHLTVEKERMAWLNVIDHAIQLYLRRRVCGNT